MKLSQNDLGIEQKQAARDAAVERMRLARKLESLATGLEVHFIDL
ncbi:hypothetical protein [Diaphorobacter ruginosibacter]|nr:hypothetical protein [Diaphorobacter ruginosibacter]